MLIFFVLETFKREMEICTPQAAHLPSIEVHYMVQLLDSLLNFIETYQEKNTIVFNEIQNT